MCPGELNPDSTPSYVRTRVNVNYQTTSLFSLCVCLCRSCAKSAASLGEGGDICEPRAGLLTGRRQWPHCMHVLYLRTCVFHGACTVPTYVCIPWCMVHALYLRTCVFHGACTVPTYVCIPWCMYCTYVCTVPTYVCIPWCMHCTYVRVYSMVQENVCRKLGNFRSGLIFVGNPQR